MVLSDVGRFVRVVQMVREVGVGGSCRCYGTHTAAPVCFNVHFDKTAATIILMPTRR